MMAPIHAISSFSSALLLTSSLLVSGSVAARVEGDDGPQLSLSGLTVTLDASLPRPVLFEFEGKKFSSARLAENNGSALLDGGIVSIPPPPDVPCTSTTRYCPQLASCFEACLDKHQAPYCYQSSCCPSKTFGSYNWSSSLGFYECTSTPCLANCTAVFAKGLPPVPPPPPTPTPTPSSPPASPPAPLDGIVLVQIGGRRDLFRANNLTTTWTVARNGSSASWRVTLGAAAAMTGTVNLIADSDGTGSPAFHWDVDKVIEHHATALANQTRWVELGFGFASVSETGDGYTTQACHSGKRPVLSGSEGPSYSDWSWSCGVAHGSVSGMGQNSSSRSLGVGHYSGGWSADGSVGWGTWSSQRSATAAIEGRLFNGTFSAGISRIDVRMRCGSVLPFSYRVGFFNDISLDGKVDATDVVVWNRRQFPEAHTIYKTHLVWKLGNSYHSCRAKGRGYTPPVVTFNETLDWIREMSLISGGMSQIVYLVGWQGTGHDTLYPSLDVINGALGTKEDLHRLAQSAQNDYNTIISYHINTDEAYANYSQYIHNVSQLEFVDGLVNTDVNIQNLALNPDGSGYEWSPHHSAMAFDPLQGPAYHLSKTKDFVSGQRIKRLERIFDTIPVNASLHCDAWRDINLSYENITEDDPWGWIHENEEMRCGCQTERTLYERHGDMRIIFFSVCQNAKHLPKHSLANCSKISSNMSRLCETGVSFGVEGPNGMSSDVRGLVDYYWHVGDIFSAFGKIVGGGCNSGPGVGCCAMGCSIDGDYSPGCTEAGHPGCIAAHCKTNGWSCSVEHPECCGFPRKTPMDWYVSADDIYMKTRLFQIFLTDEMVSPDGQFANGGNTTSWPIGGSMVMLVNGTGRLLPSIKVPPESAGPRARATIDVSDEEFSLVVYEQACTYHSIPGQSIPTCPMRTGPPRSAVTHHWVLPKAWHGKHLQATTLTPNGTQMGPPLAVDKALGTVTLTVTPGWPVTLKLQG